jgi:hypothetical protein
MFEPNYLEPLEILERIEKDESWTKNIKEQLGEDIFEKCHRELSDPKEIWDAYLEVQELICHDANSIINNMDEGWYYPTVTLYGHYDIELYWVQTESGIDGIYGNEYDAIKEFEYLNEEDEEEELAEEEVDNRPREIYLPFINMYFPIKASCRSCQEPFTFSGQMKLTTDSGPHLLHEYQCQDCGKLSYSGEQTDEEGIQVAVSEPCECGGQRRRDKNIFCPSCAYRKSEDNRREENLCISEEQFEALRERHLTKFLE